MGGPQHRAPHHFHKLTFDKVSFMAVFLVLPLTIFVIFVLSPFAQALYYAMTNWTGFATTMDFIGLKNFTALFSDDMFLKALRNNVLLAIFVPLITLLAAFLIACVVTVGGPTTGQVRGLRASGIYRVISFFPYAVPAIIIGLIWAQVYDPMRGLLNGFLMKIGLDHFTNFAWLGKSSTALGASMFVVIWGLIGFYTILFVAAIKSIPAETYEAARIDGAGRVRLAVSITLPQILTNVRTSYIYIGIMALDCFTYMQALNPGGGPSYSTLTMSQAIFTVAFERGKFGYATAMGVVLAAVTLIFVGLVFIVFRIVQGKPERGRA